MVKYTHCEKCKEVYDTESWIGEVHQYNGVCPSCLEEKQRIDEDIKESLDEITEDNDNIPQSEIKSAPQLEIDKILFLNLEQKAEDVISGKCSVDVLVKEIRDDLINNAKVKIEQSFESFDVQKMDAQKSINYVENILDYLSDYEVYISNVIRKLENNPKMKVKSALNKVYKESTGKLPRNIAKNVLLNKKEVLKYVSEKAVNCYNIYSDIKDNIELTKKMASHPFSELREKLSDLPFYTS